MPEEYKQHKGKHGWYVAATGAWKCDSCGTLLRTKTNYEYSTNGIICFSCRLTVPKHIPEEQILKWIKQQKNVNLVG